MKARVEVRQGLYEIIMSSMLKLQYDVIRDHELLALAGQRVSRKWLPAWTWVKDLSTSRRTYKSFL